MDPAKLPDATRAWLGNTVSVAGREALEPALERLARQAGAGRRRGHPGLVRPDAAGSGRGRGGWARIPVCCRRRARTRSSSRAPATPMPRDAVAVCRFLHFLAEAGPRGSETEMSAAAKLLALRREVAGFRGESFPAISGAGEHGAIIHYRVTEESNRRIRPERGLSDRFRRASSRTARPTSPAPSGPGPANRRRNCGNGSRG